MRPRNWVLGIIPITLLIVSLQPQCLAGQSLWDIPSFQQNVALEVSKPFFDGGDVSFPTSTTFLSVSWPFSDRFRFVGEIPVAYASWDSDYEDESDSDLAIGNPFVGLSIGREESNLTGLVGLRLPLVPDFEELGEAEWIGMLTHTVDRMGAFWPRILPIQGAMTYTHRRESGFVAMLTGGADFWISLNNESGIDDFEAIGLYGGRLGYDGPEWRVLGGIVGRGILTEDHATLPSATEHEAGLEIGFQRSWFRPTGFVRIPLDKDRRDSIKAIAGLNLRIVI